MGTGDPVFLPEAKPASSRIEERPGFWDVEESRPGEVHKPENRQDQASCQTWMSGAERELCRIPEHTADERGAPELRNIGSRQRDGADLADQAAP